MWAYVDGTILIAPKGDDRSHQQWLTDLFGRERAVWSLLEYPRGYVLDNEIRAYIYGKGPLDKEDPYSDRMERSQLRVAVELLIPMFNLKSPKIGVGAVPSKEDEVWPARRYVSKAMILKDQ